MSGKIIAANKTIGLASDPNDATNLHGDITGATVGTKRGIHVVALGSANYATRTDEDGSTTYVGKAAIGSATSSAVWQIFKVVDTSGDLAVSWADGDDGFDNIWDNRASLTYN